MRKLDPKKMLMMFLFCSLIPIFNQIVIPHFIFLGVIFVKGPYAIIINSLILLSISSLIYFIYKRHTISTLKAYVLYGILGVNSSINLIASLFFLDDISGFITSIYQVSGLFLGYILNQVAVLGLAVLVIWYVTIKKDDLK